MTITTRGLLRLGIVGVAAALSLTACSGSSGAPSTSASANTKGLPQVIAQSGEIRIGTSPDFPPMEYKDEKTGETVGADIELMNAMAADLGVKVKLVESPFDQLLNSAATGRVDIVMSGISDTKERQATVDFVDYYNSTGRLYTTAANAAKYVAETDVCGKKVAVSSKTDYYDQLANLSKSVCEGAGKPAIERLGTDSGAAARLQIEQGRADLAVQGGENLAYLDKTTPGKYKVVLKALPGTPFGVVLKKGNTELTTAIQASLQRLVKSGEYKKILEKWGLQDGAMDPVVNGIK